MPRRRWRVWLGYAVATAALFYVVRYLGINAEAFADGLRRISPAGIVLALGAFGLHVLMNALAFAPLNRAFGVDLPAARISPVWVSTLLAKYVPGGVWHVVGRGLMLNRLGVPARTSAWVGAAEQAISLSVCILVAVVLLLEGLDRRAVAFACAAIGAVGLLWLAPLLLTRLVKPIFRKQWLWAVGGYALSMVPYAMGYIVLTMPVEVVAFLQALFMGTIAGVLALPVPGGLGVREAGAVLLVPPEQAGPVMATLLAARLLIITAESVASVLGLAILRRAPSNEI